MQSFNPKSKTRVRLLAGAAVAAVIGVGAVTALPTISTAETTAQATAPFIAGAPSSFADLAAKVSPAVRRLRRSPAWLLFAGASRALKPLAGRG